MKNAILTISNAHSDGSFVKIIFPEYYFSLLASHLYKTHEQI